MSKILSRSFKTEIVFSESDIQILDGQSKICNWLYNYLLDLSINDFKYSGNTLNLASSFNARDYMVNTLKQQKSFIKTVYSTVLKNTCNRLSDSYKRMFKKQTKFPKFKSWKYNWFSLEYDDIKHAGVKILNYNLTLSLGKDLNNHQLHVTGKLKDKIPYENYKLNTLILKKEHNKFYIIINLDLPRIKPDVTSKEKWIVLDPNHKNFFVALDNNFKSYEFGNPECFRYFDEEIDYVKSRLDKCTKESKNYNKYNKVLNNLYHRKREQTKQVLYGIANWLNKEYDFIGVGDYVPSTQTAIYDNMHRSMLNQTHIGELRRVVKQVCEKSYKQFKKLNERNTTKRCSCCGDMEKHNPNERLIICKNCGTVIYRDLNSTINFAINEGFILSGTDLVDVDLSTPTYTFNLNHKVNSIHNLVVKERQIKLKSR